DLNLADVLVQQVDDTNGAGFSVAFDYRDISIVTKGQTSTGQVTQTGSFGWDTLTNTKFDPADMPSISPCYCPGTLILTDRGEVPVEDLAIDDTVPRRDLWISPHHAMYLDGVLIEAIDLVNGATIIQADEVERVEYFHIE